MKYVVSKFKDDRFIYPVYECEDEEEAIKTAYACNGVYEKVSPSLTDDQQVVLEWMKESCNADDYTTPMLAIYKLYSSQQMAPNLVFLTAEQQFQVLAAFVEWGLKEDNQ